MRPGKGKSKGSQFERDVARLIVKAFRKHGIQQRECWRSVLSGGHEMSAGDLYMSDRLVKLFPYAVECKSYRKIDWKNFWMHPSFRKSSWKELQWWAQADEGAQKRKGLCPLLVVKENHGGIWCLEWEDGVGLMVSPFWKWLQQAAQ